MYMVYHRAATVQALGEYFSPEALEEVVAANLGQDHWLRGQIGHAEYHFDQNAFAKGRTYLEKNRLLARAALEAGTPVQARQALGRLTHAAQDFYSHSTYISLWLTRFREGQWPAPADIDPLDRGLIENPELRSGKLYYPLELLSFIPSLKKAVLPLMPPDSHARMNIDGPERGPLFPYVFEAAVKRTCFEFKETTRDLPPELLVLFVG
jgi:hypothetical protein